MTIHLQVVIIQDLRHQAQLAILPLFQNQFLNLNRKNPLQT